MENENKEKVILTDEELKEVAGGKEVLSKHALSYLIRDCEKLQGAKICIQQSNGLCAYVNNKCIPNPKKFEY